MSKTAKTKPQVLNSIRKPPIILVHGFHSSPTSFVKIVTELRRHDYEVLLPPIPPCSSAQKLPQYTPEYYTNYLASYIQDHNLSQPILTGHSIGTVIVAAMLTQYPKLVNQKSVLLSPISHRIAAPFRAFASLSAFLPRHAVDFIATTYLFISPDRHLLQQALKITRNYSNNQSLNHSEILSTIAFSNHYCVADFHPTHQQLLILAGEKDRLINPKKTKQLAHILDAKLAFLPNCGHLHHYEKPHETVREILDFLEDAR